MLVARGEERSQGVEVDATDVGEGLAVLLDEEGPQGGDVAFVGPLGVGAQAAHVAQVGEPRRGGAVEGAVVHPAIVGPRGVVGEFADNWYAPRSLFPEVVMALSLHSSLVGRSLADILKTHGVVGAGGAGFPTWAKYTAPQPVLVVNAQESEPGYFIDKWLHDAKAQELVDLLAWLRGWGVQKTVVAAKQKDRASFARMEQAAGVGADGPPGARVLDCTARNRHVLLDQAEPVLFTYTDDKYAFGMETALLLIVAQKKIPQGERPSQHGFIVSNTETLWNIHEALTQATPVTRKYVHVYGATPRHTFRSVPIGTPASVVLEDAGVVLDEIAARGLIVVDGGPGWFERVDPATAVVSRRTNSFLVLDPAEVDTAKNDVLPGVGKVGYPRSETAFATSPSELAVGHVIVPLVDNPKFKAVSPARPSVPLGAHVRRGDVLAVAADEGVSVDVHASIDGTVVGVDERGVHLQA